MRYPLAGDNSNPGFQQQSAMQSGLWRGIANENLEHIHKTVDKPIDLLLSFSQPHTSTAPADLYDLPGVLRDA